MKISKFRVLLAVLLFVMSMGALPDRVELSAGQVAGRTAPRRQAARRPAAPNARVAVAESAPAPAAPAPTATEAPPQDSLGDPPRPKAAPQTPASTAQASGCAPRACTPCKPVSCVQSCAPRRPLLARLARGCRPKGNCCRRAIFACR